MALVVDEYGNLQGVVTQTDLLEAIAGDLPDPQGANDPECVHREDGSFVCEGSMSVYDVKEVLGLGEIPRAEYHTLAGFALSQLGRVPEPGDHFDFAGWRLEQNQRRETQPCGRVSQPLHQLLAPTNNRQRGEMLAYCAVIYLSSEKRGDPDAVLAAEPFAVPNI